MLVFLLAGMLLVHSAQAARLALVIGNDRYKTVTPLQNAGSDAKAIATALKQIGFKVTLKLDVDQPAFKSVLRDFKEQISGGDEVVFFYSGHGVQIGSANYLLPVDIQGEKESQVLDDAIALQKVLDNLDEQKARFSLAIIDACRDNPFKASGKRSIGGTRGLTVTSAATGQMIMFSAGTGQQALDRTGPTDRDPNGLFTRVLLKEMQKPGEPVDQVLRNVREQVVQMARSINHEQVPALYDQMIGKFYFVASLEPVAVPQPTKIEPVSVPVQAHLKSRDEIEQDTWDGVRDSGSAGAIQEYLKQYPKGRFVGQARVLIATLKGGAVKPVEPVVANAGRSDGEGDLWAEVQKGNSVEDYRAYLAQYPKGKYAVLAKGRFAKFEKEAADAVRAQREAAAQQLAQQEQGAWDAANSGAGEAGYQSYLNSYPNGKYATLATGRIAKLRKEAALAQQQAVERQRQDEERKRKLAETPKGYITQGGLTWMPVSDTKYTYAEASTLCSGTINGQGGWRLPTKDELVSLHNSGAMKGQGWTLSFTWSSMPGPHGDSGGHYAVNLYDGVVASIGDTAGLRVTCVR